MDPNGINEIIDIINDIVHKKYSIVGTLSYLLNKQSFVFTNYEVTSVPRKHSAERLNPRK